MVSTDSGLLLRCWTINDAMPGGNKQCSLIEECWLYNHKSYAYASYYIYINFILHCNFDLSIELYVYMCMCVCVCVCVF